MAIVGIPSTRISNSFINDRLTNQVHMDQIELFRLQAQLSTGYRFQRSGEDPIAASATLTLQTELERKAQVQSNLDTTQSYFSATDSALAQISGLMNEVRAMGLEAINTTTSDTQRTVLAQQVQQSTNQLMDAGNQKFRDRYLFAGSVTDQKPFEYGSDQNVITYVGNELHLSSFVDIGLLYETNITGKDVFNAVSDPVLGTVDVNPALTYDTHLSTLRGGKGISLGTISVSDGATTSLVDLENCVTIGDVAQRIASNPPVGSIVNISVTPTGLLVALDPSTPGNLQIHDVGNGITSRELGIYTSNGVGMNQIVGGDLDPVVTNETLTDDIFGARSVLACHFPGENNDFIVEADSNGTIHDGFQIEFFGDPLIGASDVNAVYDIMTNTMTVHIGSSGARAEDVLVEMNNAMTIEGLDYTVRLDETDETTTPGRGMITLALNQTLDCGATAYGADGTFDPSGVQIINGEESYTVRFTDCTTVEEVLNELNGSEAGVLAEINDMKNGINLRSRVSGADFMIGENGGLSATQFGVRTLVDETQLDEMNFGRGVMDYNGPGVYSQASYSSAAENSQLVIRAIEEGTQWNDFKVTFVDTPNPDGTVNINWDEVNKTITIGITPGITSADDVVAAFKSQPGPRDAFEIELDKSVDQTNDGTGVLYKGTATTAAGEDGGIDFTITAADGSILDIDINGSDDIGDILTLINTATTSDGMPVDLVASLVPFGNGIMLTDNTVGDHELTVTRSKLSMAAIDLGLIPEGKNEHAATYAGTISQALCDPIGVDNSLTFRSRYPGVYGNDVEVVYEEVAAVGDPPSFAVTSNAGHYVFTFKVDTDVLSPTPTTAQQVMDLFNADAPLNIKALFEVTTNETDLSGTLQTGNWTFAGGESPDLSGTDNNQAETESMFTALIRLQEGLVENDILKIQRAVTVLDESVKQMNFARADAGARMQSLISLGFRLEDENVELRSALSNEHDADMVKVVTEMSSREVALEAGFKAIATSYQMSLLNYI